MCGRITATFEFNDMKIRWNLEHDLAAFVPRFNIAPEQSTSANEQKVPVIVRHENSNHCRLMHWGLIPNWAKDPTIGNQMINARAETLTEKPAFKDLVARRRCIVPADGFYEWRKEGKRKIPMWVHLKTREPFGLAGLWDVWRNPNGKRVESFTIITTEPNELVRPIHNRMPVILRPDDEEQWLDVHRTSFGKARSLLKRYPDELMAAHDVSAVVNSANYDGPECIQPASDDAKPSGQLSLL
ncbi:MAG TPA: SOS response-associated peptidase [Candidatus Udaeobacter sp.]|jgi:putative SOS response-associated peptidase YedK|nr:SOS response-associated peptidase [Candidatus Udaeobacter sp.]